MSSEPTYEQKKNAVEKLAKRLERGGKRPRAAREAAERSARRHEFTNPPSKR